MPAAAVIPAPISYIKVDAVKKLVVGSREWAGGPQGEPPPVPDPASRRPPDAHNWVPGAFTLKKLECSKPSPLNTTARIME